MDGRMKLQYFKMYKLLKCLYIQNNLEYKMMHFSFASTFNFHIYARKKCYFYDQNSF